MEVTFIPTDLKVEVIDILASAGLRKIEATSFVKPEVIPQMRDADKVMARIQRFPGVCYAALVPNVKGAQRALEAGADSIRVVICLSESYNRRNVGMTISESLENCLRIFQLTKARGVELTKADGVACEVVLALSFGCPLEGEVSQDKVVEIANRLIDMGFRELSIADSIGVANPVQVKRLMRKLRHEANPAHYSLHFHNTRGLGLANVVAGLEEGVDAFDSSCGGLGGCPVVPGGSGNIPTEDLVNMLEEMGIHTGVDLSMAMTASKKLQDFLRRPMASYVLASGTRSQLFEGAGKMPQALTPSDGAPKSRYAEGRDKMKDRDATKELYGARGFAGRVGFGERPAILVIDLIQAFTEAGSPLAADLSSQIAATLELLGVAREADVPIVFTTVEYDPSLKDAGLFTRKVGGLKWLVTGSPWVELHPALNRKEGELIVRKKYASAFFGTDLASYLATQRVDTVIVAGCTTSGCVRATVVDALQYGLHAIIPREAVGDRAQSPHEANLFDIDMKYGDVVGLHEVLDYLRRRAQQPLPADHPHK
jgi:hydroxymethylglutaryl-CoA lyase